jgi:hypothetical protein
MFFRNPGTMCKWELNQMPSLTVYSSQKPTDSGELRLASAGQNNDLDFVMNTKCFVAGIALVMLSCAASLAHAQAGVTDPLPPGAKTENFDLLFMGNSHSKANDLPGLVATLIETGKPLANADAANAPGFMYLADRQDDGVSPQLLASRPWSHVVLQAQKYSTSGLYYYPTDAAEEWIRRAKAQNTQPILFPEWPRRGNTEEGKRVHNLHLSISSREAACVAPIGLAWEKSIADHPEIELHAPDGNHSNIQGALLSAYVFYEVMSRQPAADLPVVSSIKVSPDVQGKLKNTASEVVATSAETCLQTIYAPTEVSGIPALSPGGLAVLLLSVLGLSALVLIPRP